MILKPSPTLSGPSFVRPSRLRWYLKEESYKCTVIYIYIYIARGLSYLNYISFPRHSVAF